MKKYTLFIPCAGTGTRTGQYAKHINKALITIGEKPVICHIIDQYLPIIDHVVIALGYKGDMVKQVLTNFYNKDLFTFVDIEKYEGEGSGLGLTILNCQKYLNKPFIFNSNDTLCDISSKFNTIMGNNINNFVCYSNNTKNIGQYRTLTLQSNIVKSINPKLPQHIINKQKKLGTSVVPYIGVCVINQYKTFWEKMHQKKVISVVAGQVIGIPNNQPIIALECKQWCDTGNYNNILQIQQLYKPTDKNILPKETQSIWFTNDKVIKFSIDKTFIKDRVQRLSCLKENNQLYPSLLESGDYTYSYKKIEGTTFSNVINKYLFYKLLVDTDNNIWKHGKQNKTKENILVDFYQNKTIKRIEQYLQKYQISNEEQQIINGVKIPSIFVLLKALFKTGKLTTGLFTNKFHGDFHFQNILIDNQNNFKFIDWRQNFGENNFEYGDVYYDMGKFLQGLIVSHHKIVNQQYNVIIDNNNISFQFDVPYHYQQYTDIFFLFLQKNNYSIEKVKYITALVFLNIAVLHTPQSYGHLLFALGKYMLYDAMVTYETI